MHINLINPHFPIIIGGVGKTNIIFNLAGCLSERGKKVLLLDGDPQNNLSKCITGKNHNMGLYELLTGYSAVINEYELKSSKRKSVAVKVPQHKNFKQREYDKGFFDKIYENVS